VRRLWCWGQQPLAGVLFAALPSIALADEPPPRQIEEIVITAERKESTVSDTAISITAFTGQMLQDFGIRNQEDLQKYIPATVIEPYSVSIRGIGTNYGALGGDPGIATYSNGVYSEYFGIASTENGLFDVQRIEVLRGPQGTLYGRNAIGGAINFIDKAPTNEFEGEAHVVAGNYDLREEDGVLSGPLIDDVLSARLTGTKRTHDGYIDDKSGNQNPDNYGDENYALSLRWTPTDNFELNTRGNERSARRRIGTAQGIVTLTEDAGTPDPVTGNPRNTSTFTFAYRPVDDTVCPTLTSGRTDELVGQTRVAGCRITTATAGYQNQPGSTMVYTFTDPVTGQPVTAQRVTPGVDFSTTGNNAAFGTDPSRQHMLGLGSLKGPDVSTDTSGHQDEYFDHQANSTDIRWTVNDQFSIKYIFGYADFFYDWTTDNDLTSNTDANTIYSGDVQFYLSQATDYVSHELQFFNDFTDKLSTTSGLFYYRANTTQRGDFYDSNGNGIYTQNFDYSAAAPYDFIGFFPKVGLFTAKQSGLARRHGVPSGLPPITDAGCSQVPWNGDPFEYCFGAWEGDTGDRIPHGPKTPGTSTEYQTRTEREAFAAYSQSVYSFNEHFALTLGARWARDQLDGEENASDYSEGGGGQALGGNMDAAALTAMNIAIGALAPDGTVLDYNQLRTNGVPKSESYWRQMRRKDDAVTGRINLDWTPNDQDLVYLSVTSGYRSGGFALGFFSYDARTKPENITSYELGYKGEVLDGTMQINSALYYYDYKNVQTFAASPVPFGGFSQGAFSVPSAEVDGLDMDMLWLFNQRITLGATFSYTHSEYTSNFYIIDVNNAQRPQSLFDPETTPVNIKGNSMLHVPEMKADTYAEYAYPLGNEGSVTFLADYSWIDKVYFSEFVTSSDKAPAYSRVDLRATWKSAAQNWTIAAFVDNLFDDIGIRSINADGEGANFRRDGTLTEPRTYGLDVRYQFGAFK